MTRKRKSGRKRGRDLGGPPRVDLDGEIEKLSGRVRAAQPRAAVPHIVEAAVSRCPNPKCLSTEREHYNHTTVQPYGGRTTDGLPYTHIVRRWTRCARCHQVRIDRSLEYRPPVAAVPGRVQP